MSEAPPQEATPDKKKKKKKKGSKLPVILILLLVFGGGGFFMLKAKKGHGAAPTGPQLGAVVPLSEFLVNLSDGATYLRTEISLQFDKKFDQKKMDDEQAAVRDAIVLKLSSESPTQVRTLDGKLQLKRDLADAINHVLNEKPSGSPDVTPPPTDAPSKGAPAHADWDSDTGPVLKVFFTSFATQ